MIKEEVVGDLSFIPLACWFSWMSILLLIKLRVRLRRVGNILLWRLMMKYFLRSFPSPDSRWVIVSFWLYHETFSTVIPVRWFKKGNCQMLAKECIHVIPPRSRDRQSHLKPISHAPVRETESPAIAVFLSQFFHEWQFCDPVRETESPSIAVFLSQFFHEWPFCEYLW